MPEVLTRRGAFLTLQVSKYVYQILRRRTTFLRERGLMAMSSFSRRSILAGTIVLPASATVRLASPLEGASTSGIPDAVVSHAAAWTAADENLTAMQLRWQDYETAVFDKARRMKINCARACESNWPEAQAMRALDLQITAAYAHLEALAGKVRRMRATTISGAVAKVQLGLQVQGPYDWQEHALELTEDGLAELRKMTGVV